MCLAIPARLSRVEGDQGIIDVAGIERDVSLALLPSAVPGDYVIVHAGFAIQKLDEEEASKTLSLMHEMFAEEGKLDE